MTALLFKCPYCYFEIPEPATVCGHCTRDLSLIKPLLFQFSRTIEDITTIRLEINEIRKELENRPLLHDRLNTEITISSNNEEYQEVINKVSGAKGLLFLASTVLLTVIALIFTHWLFLFVYDFNLLLLRIATVILPLLFGILSYRKIDVNAGFSILGSTLLGICAVTGMLAITSYIDKVALLPESTREWREVVEYGFAISCSFFTAFLIENRRIAHRLNFRKKINLNLLIEKDASGQFKAPEWTNQVQSLFTAIAPFLSAGTAIVSGLRVFITN